MDVFNGYNTIDRTSERRPPPHDSGRQYKYRQRYAIKTRSQLKKHDPPETLQQYQLKPWKSPPESPLNPSINTLPLKATPKRQQLRDVATMEKRELVNGMQWNHPKRTLDIGTINANAKRALNNGIDQTTASTCLSAIKTSLREVTRISSRVQRTAQRAIGLYIERLLANNIDENDDNNNNTTNTINTANTANTANVKRFDDIDRNLLDILCPGFSNKDLVDSTKEGTESEPDKPEGLEEHDDSLDKKNEALSFLMSLLTAIHSTKLPKNKGMGLQVRNFIKRAQEFLPVFTECTSAMYYVGSTFLRSAALQLSVGLKKHYKNGAIDLRNKV